MGSMVKRIAVAQKGPNAPKLAWYADYVGEEYDVVDVGNGGPKNEPTYVVNGPGAGRWHILQEDCEVVEW